MNGQRLWGSLMELAQIGATPAGGVRRLALTDEDRLGRDWLKRQAQAAGLAVSIDVVGNMYLRRAGKVDMPPVLIGSHIDTQPSGGKFDGAFGVLAGLEVCRVLAEQHILTELPIEVVAWTNEEGSRVLPVMAGSGVYAGVYDADTVLDARASDGARFGDELARIGYTGTAGLVSRPAAAYLEAHIEQGPILEAQDRAIGAVRGALGQVWFEVEIIGYEAHAGPTPMDRRKDALQAAAEIISGIEAIGRIHPEARATVGMISVWPNSRNVIPGQAKFSVDLRHPDQSGCNDMSGRFLALVEEVSSRRGVDASLKKTNDWAPMEFDTQLVDHVRNSAMNRGYPWMDVVSGAGHDAVYLARVCPTAMVFIPCKDGISHNESEYARFEHVEAGANVLLDCVLWAAGQAYNR
ncbi:Zn-dependent hydrolase [Phenylobacterium sp.]|uniref:Zn-dependent hydrolase n=1 Tax=Phenylobacterium sp. TaxID=1871053 RepID=UPI0025D2B908|nr:Zn-dependent hydrolase [Phenylobacterium sp.]